MQTSTLFKIWYTKISLFYRTIYYMNMQQQFIAIFLQLFGKELI